MIDEFPDLKMLLFPSDKTIKARIPGPRDTSMVSNALDAVTSVSRICIIFNQECFKKEARRLAGMSSKKYENAQSSTIMYQVDTRNQMLTSLNNILHSCRILATELHCIMLKSIKILLEMMYMYSDENTELKLLCNRMIFL